MKIIGVTEFGGPDALAIHEVEEPHAGPGEVRIEVRAFGCLLEELLDRSTDSEDGAGTFEALCKLKLAALGADPTKRPLFADISTQLTELARRCGNYADQACIT